MKLSDLPKMGSKSIEALKASGIETINDFVYNIPRTYLDQTKVTPVCNLKAGKRVVLIGRITRAGIIRGRSNRFVAFLGDGTGEISLIFFQGLSYHSKRIIPSSRWVVTGIVGDYRGLQITHPDMEPLDEQEQFTGQIQPVYSITEAMAKSRITQRSLKNWYKQLFENPNLSVTGLCPKALTNYLQFHGALDNLKALHLPTDFKEIKRAKQELKILELLPFCMRMIKRRQNQMVRGHQRQINLGLVMNAKSKLSFSLTQAQENALNEIIFGLNGKKQFHALLQGDVGCGKTVVALLSMLAVCGAGEQCALMVPTDILARQHYKQMKPIFEAAGFRVELLVGATTASQRKVILGELQMGLCQCVIGTHALFSKNVEFKKLGFVIIDEQHRFGVGQREALLAKGEYPDMLVMSATPIPRSLAMTLYGDLKVISIKEKPAGRKPIKTRLVPPSKRNDMKAFIAKEAKEGNLCYWIVSKVNGDDKESDTPVKSVDEIVQELRDFDKALVVEGIHGQMDETLRDEILKNFSLGKIHILVSTTVVEVGVNVPEANIMAIDAPDRFGLAQLHQLRGRVGRGNVQAWCFLMMPQGESAENSVERLTQFSHTDDGFEIAELDLQTRGAGNLEGNQQSGSWVFRWFDWIHDQELISKTLVMAENILKEGNKFTEVEREQIQLWYQENPSANEDGIH